MKIKPSPKLEAPKIECALDWGEMPEPEKASGFEFVGPFIQRAYDARCVSDRTEVRFIAGEYERLFSLEAVRDVELMRARIARHLQYEGFRYAEKLNKLTRDFMVKYAESWKEKEKAMKPVKKSIAPTKKSAPSASAKVSPKKPGAGMAAKQSGVKTKPQSATEWVFKVLQQAGTPLHISEIHKRMAKAGHPFTGKTPTATIAAIMLRSDSVRKVSPGTFTLR
jgi:hypothetical protein